MQYCRYRPDDLFQNAMILLDAVENFSGTKLFTYYESDIQKFLKDHYQNLLSSKEQPNSMRL
jgi:DNA-directed RNA polymerase specialized sigma subunit